MSLKTKNSPLKIIVTGGAGFIGSAVIRELINHTDHTVVNVDKLTYAGNLESIVYQERAETDAPNTTHHSPLTNKHPRYTFEQVDICDAAEVKRVFNEHQPDIVMHLAAESHVDRSIDGPGAFIHTNIVGTYTLLDQARAYWNDLEADNKANFRFHHISTDEVYGDLPHPDAVNSEQLAVSSTQSQGTANHSLPTAHSNLPLFTEETAYAPSSPYSASKAGSDHLVRAWQRTYGLPTLVTNCSNNYGPYHFPEKLIPLVILNALEGKDLPIYGKGNQIRDWLYVEDHARALIKVATEGKVGETYNIGGHNEKQNIEVVDTICEILDELAPIQNSKLNIKNYKDLKVFVTDRPGHDMRYAIDASKIERELGWTPQETFESGIKKTIQWYLDNQAWWQSVQDGSYQRQRLGSL